MKIGIATPTYNEALNIETHVENLWKVTSDIKEHTFEILIIDDNSPDGTGIIADKLSNKYVRENFSLSVLHRKIKNGLGRAYIDGFTLLLEKGCEYILQMDADLSHDPVYIPTFLSKIPEHDLVVASRYVEGGRILDWGVERKALSAFGNFFARFVTGLNLKDCTGGFNMYRGSLLEKIDLDTVKSNGYCFIIEMKWRCMKAGAKVFEFPIDFRDRILGASKISKKIIFEAFKLALKLRFLGHA